MTSFWVEMFPLNRTPLPCLHTDWSDILLCVVTSLKSILSQKNYVWVFWPLSFNFSLQATQTNAVDPVTRCQIITKRRQSAQYTSPPANILIRQRIVLSFSKVCHSAWYALKLPKHWTVFHEKNPILASFPGRTGRQACNYFKSSHEDHS